MKSIFTPLRGLSLIVAVGLVASVFALTGTDPAAASSCPTVEPNGTVTPAPAPGVDWSGCDLHGANLRSANLANANLTGADLSGAILAYASLSGANLTDADLDATSFYFAVLTGATLTGATMSSETILQYVVSGQIAGSPTALPNSEWQLIDGYLVGPYASLTDADLPGADLAGGHLFGAFLQSADLEGADLAGADLEASLSGANLTDADLTRANFDNADLTEATVTGATVTDATMSSNTLLEGIISGGVVGSPANLPNSAWTIASGYLIGPDANLTGAELASLDLAGADFDNVNLTNADLTGANLEGDQVGGVLTGVQLAGADLDGIQPLPSTGQPASLPSSDWNYIAGFLLGPLVDLQARNLSYDDLAGVDLSGASLYDASLAHADLDGADLSDTNLWYGDLTAATTSAANFDGAGWYSTTCPDGTDSNLYVDGCFSVRATAHVTGTWAKCVDDFYGRTTGGNKIDLYSCTGGSPQVITYLTNGQLRVADGCVTGAALDVYYYPCTGASNQTWTRSGGEYVDKATGKCLTDPGNSSTNGTQLIVAACAGGVSQSWTLPSTVPTGPVIGAWAKCADDFYGRTTGGNKIDLYSCTGGSPQVITYTSGDELQVRGGCVTGAALDVYYYPCTGASNQTWTRSGGEYVDKATGKCLTDPGNSSTNGTQLIVAACAGGVSQSWTLP